MREAVTSVPTEQLFVFDRDGRTDDQMKAITVAAGGRVSFLEVRELENCFLDANAIAQRLRILAEGNISEDEVAARLAAILGDVENRKFFPSGPPAEGQTASSVVRGSAALQDLYENFALADYEREKTTEAPILPDSSGTTILRGSIRSSLPSGRASPHPSSRR